MKATKAFKSKGILKLVSQPTSIAAIASLGIHAILFVASPQLSKLSLASLANPEELDRERTVPLVNLSPEEQSRLPNFSDRPFSLVPDGSANSAFQFPIGSSPTDGGSGSSGQSSQPGRVPVPRGFFGGSGFNQSGASTYIGGAGTQNGGQANPGNGAQQNPSEAPQVSGSGASGSEGSGTQAGTGISEIQPGDDRLASLPNPNDLEFEVGAGSSQSDAGDSTEPTAESGAETANETAGVGPRSLPGSPEPSTNASDLFAAESEELRENYTYNADGTTEEEAQSNLTAWVAAVQAVSEDPELQPSEPIALPIEYPLSSCLSPSPSNAKVGVMLNVGGELAEEPTLLKSTGYLGLDRLAVSQVVETTQAEDFPAIENFSALLFEVPVQYDAENCVEAPSGDS
ncbi:MAG: hypothetical protein AAFW84_28665, partial [Cyanobacteria bacterium J06635_15]